MKPEFRFPDLLPATGLALGVWVAGCGDVIGSTDEARIVPDTISLAVGEELRLRVVMRSGDGREREIEPDSWYSFPRYIADVGERNGVLRGVAAGWARIDAVVGGERLQAPVVVGQVTFRNIDSVALALYENAAYPPAIRLPAPAIALDDRTIDANIPRPPTHWISTAYVGTARYSFQIYPDGRVAESYWRQTPGDSARFPWPSGVQRVLNIIVDYGDTDIRDKLDMWVAAQDSVNGDHRALEASLGYRSPLVQFENTNVLVDRDSVLDPVNNDSVLANVLRVGHDPDAYDIILSMPMTLDVQGGHASTLAGVVVMGCYGCPPPNEDGIARLTRDALDGMANVIYHHEIGHLWGWRHEWGGGPRGTRIITHPALFGWTDTDGDGVPEVIDPTPYGISPADTAGLGITGSIRRP
jgi:hypothetical protein